MADSNSAFSAFEALWQEATHQQADLKSVELDDFDTDIRLDPILQQLSRLANNLHNSDSIDSGQFQQMQSAIITLKEIIESIDPVELSNTLKSMD
ncbi:MAG: hypothetical protein QNL62_24180 [Gammaproteobacteria bacterium]|nr:hypothetical protein [Gammaproteobacteria bacterium]